MNKTDFSLSPSPINTAANPPTPPPPTPHPPPPHPHPNPPTHPIITPLFFKIRNVFFDSLLLIIWLTSPLAKSLSLGWKYGALQRYA